MSYDLSNNKFLRVLIAAQRAKQIRKGARPLVQTTDTRATRIAIEEATQGLIGYEFLPEKSNSINGVDKRPDRGRGVTGETHPEAPKHESVANLTAVAKIGD